MTRADARLLGPCFKTGPESTQIKSVADRRILQGLSENSAASSGSGSKPALGPTAFEKRTDHTCDVPDANIFAAQRRSPTVERADREHGVRERALESVRAVSTHALRPAPNGSRRSTRGEVHAFDDGRKELEPTTRRSPVTTSQLATVRDTLNHPFRNFGFLRFTPERFHVLLNSLFKVLFNFPSRYLFAIGLVVIFSLRWSLPPT